MSTTGPTASIRPCASRSLSRYSLAPWPNAPLQAPTVSSRNARAPALSRAAPWRHPYARAALLARFLLTYICVPILRLIHYVSPHTTVCVLILRCWRGVSSYLYMCPHTSSLLILLLRMCPHITITYVSSYSYTCVHIALLATCVSPFYSSYYYLCALILLHMCPHTTIYVSSYRASSYGTAGL